jgi:hypothetical protein
VTWVWEHLGDIGGYAVSHALLAGIPLLVGLALALPLGWLARRFPRVAPVIVGGSGLLYTIPSLALFILMPLLLGSRILDSINVYVAMTIYTVALLVRSVVDALGSVPEATALAATAMGYRRVGRALAVELPLAVPVLASGAAGGGGVERQHRVGGLTHRLSATRVLPDRRLSAVVPAGDRGGDRRVRAAGAGFRPGDPGRRMAPHPLGPRRRLLVRCWVEVFRHH